MSFKFKKKEFAIVITPAYLKVRFVFPWKWLLSNETRASGIEVMPIDVIHNVTFTREQNEHSNSSTAFVYTWTCFRLKSLKLIDLPFRKVIWQFAKSSTRLSVLNEPKFWNWTVHSDWIKIWGFPMPISSTLVWFRLRLDCRCVVCWYDITILKWVPIEYLIPLRLFSTYPKVWQDSFPNKQPGWSVQFLSTWTICTDWLMDNVWQQKNNSQSKRRNTIRTEKITFVFRLRDTAKQQFT